MSSLTSGTLGAWWRCLPLMLIGLTLGLIGYHGLLILSAFISDQHPWLALVLLSCGFTSLLVGYLYSLRVLGRDLSVGQEVLRTKQGESLVDEPLSRLVALTLLPFIGIYAVFGRIQETSGQLVTYETITRGLLADGVLSTLNPGTTRAMLIVLAVLAGSFILRRTLDTLLERTGRRIFGILTGLVETFFTLVLIYGGSRMINRAKTWVADRRVAGWWRDLLDQIAGLLAKISIHLPDWIAALWDGILGPGWRAFSAGLAEPLLWLAIAALAFGSRVMSASELLRETLGGRPTPLNRITITPRPGLERLWAETKELFLGDIDDKYLPTLHSLKLVLSAGVSLIGAFCLLHTLSGLAGEAVTQLFRALVGPRESVIWVAVSLVQELARTLVAEPLRLALLSVTYLRCLQLLSARAHEMTSDE